MKGLVVEITFSEALFRTHLTKSFWQTYPIPLPTTVAGIFGALLGLGRDSISEEFRNCLFGAKLLKYKGICPEKSTFVQYKSSGRRIEKGVITTTLLNNPTFSICLVSSDRKIDDFYNKLRRKGITFFPYGGRNEFFTEDIKINGVKEVVETSLIENYAPVDLVEKVELNEGTELQILPVKHKITPNQDFYFIFNGKLKLRKKLEAVEGIGVFSLSDFFYKGEVDE